MNEKELDRLERQNREIRNLVSPENQEHVDRANDPDNTFLLAVTVVSLAIITLVVFVITVSDIISWMGKF